MNPLPEPVWADSDHFERTYLMWQPKEELGVLLIDEQDGRSPTVVFCSLFNEPERVFYEGRDARHAGLTLAELKDVVAVLEAKLGGQSQA